LTFYYDPASLVDIVLFVTEQLVPPCYLVRFLNEVFGIAGDDFNWKFLEIVCYEFIYKKVSAIMFVSVQIQTLHHRVSLHDSDAKFIFLGRNNFKFVFSDLFRQLGLIMIEVNIVC